MKKIKSSFLALCTLSVLSTACTDVAQTLNLKKEKKKHNRITNVASTNEIIENEGIKLQVISESALKEAALSKSILSITNPVAIKTLQGLPQGEAAENIRDQDKSLEDSTFTKKAESLLVGFPIGLVGEQNVFGGVITTVTDRESDSLGTLKLTDLSPIHVRTVISRLSTGAPVMTLVGCFANCSEDSNLQGLINFPIVGFNQETSMIIVDMAAIGKELDLISMLDPKGEYTKLKAISSETVSVDFDMKTLIFDIKTKMVPVTTKKGETPEKTTDFTVRWYMKLNSGFNPAFLPREASEGVGFFKTERSASKKITRFSSSGDGTTRSPVKYFIKNVPEEFKPHFEKAIQSWNREFKKLLNKELIEYEFVDAKDAKAELLVPGDIRYNIIEWDLVNKAGYGGLGPSIANQYTGETLSANVLIQGPTIVKLYTQWFGVSAEASALLAEGRTEEANRLIKEFETKVSQEMTRRTQKTFKLKLGKHLDMTVHAQRPELQDPIYKGHFELVPEGMTYEKYMEGYMIEILAHELGHNLGLRHNFKGNLGAYENNGDPGSVSRSVMEYLGRPFRHLNIIGPYDRMAIAYGYKGTTPKHKNWFCTDEDQGTDAKSILIKSPECTKNDATSDPFSFFEGRLLRAIDMVIDLSSMSAPVWKVSEVKTQIDDAITGLVAYAASAEATAQTWTNFFGKNDRPENKADVKSYVLQRIKSRICDPQIQAAINTKDSAEALKAAEDNYKILQETIAAKAVSLGVYSLEEMNCGE